MSSTAPDADLATARARWQDPDRGAAERVAALLGAMTLEEKLGQLGSVWLQDADDDGDGNVAPMQDVLTPTTDWDDVVEVGLGHLTRPFGTAPIEVEAGMAQLAARQRDLVARSRLGLPAIAHEECLTGFTTLGATVHPTPLAWAATFDPDLVEEVGAAIGHDMRSVDVHQGLSPVLDVARDPRWGRVEETLGEDPHLVGVVGSAYVRGLESQGIVATLKHFLGYSASRAARNHAPVPMGRRELLEVMAVPFEMGLALGGARSVMNSYADVDGVPPAADPWLLTTLLRDEWGFDGTVVSDYWSITFLRETHRVADDDATAGALALRAGIDVELPEGQCYRDGLADLVRAGAVDEALVDRAVARVLHTKLGLGLLDADWHPADPRDVDLDSRAGRDLAHRVAVASVVLLDNDATLPLDPHATPRVAVLGPCADDPLAFLGCYSFPNHVLQRRGAEDLGIEVPTLLAALRTAMPDTVVTHAAGCEVAGDDRSGIEPAVEAAREAGLAVLALGDRAGLFGRGTSGEGNDAPDLRLPGVQHDLATAVLDTGVPTILVFVSGRPYAVGDLTERAAASVMAFMPGEQGGPALAEVLTGRAEPRGRLPIQVPVEPGGQPASYRHPVLGEPGLGISVADTVVAHPFGHGRAYTSFTYDDVAVDDPTVATDGTIALEVTVRNVGDRVGHEVVQLYLDDPVARVVRPVRQLLGFHRVELAAGASRRVRFEVHADRVAYVGPDLQWLVEPGTLRLLVGSSSADTPHHVDVELVGPERRPGHARRLTTPATSVPLDGCAPGTARGPR